jgi:predicted RNase H-like HicB family nuclease
MKPFVALIYRGPDSIYRVSFPDFPDLLAESETFDYACANAEWALFAHIRSLGTIPERSASLEAVEADPQHQDARAVILSLVEVDDDDDVDDVEMMLRDQCVQPRGSAHSLRLNSILPRAWYCDQSGRVSIGLAPHFEHRSRSLIDGTAISAGSADTSTLASQPHAQ